MTKTTCIICYKSWESTEVDFILNDIRIRNNNFVDTFCRQFGIPLPQNIHTVKWNLEEECLPFCSSCQQSAERLIDLKEQLQSIQDSIVLLQNSIKSQILISSNDSPNVKDRRVNIIRDFIVGPVLSIPKMKIDGHIGSRQTRESNKRKITVLSPNHDSSNLDENEEDEIAFNDPSSPVSDNNLDDPEPAQSLEYDSPQELEDEAKNEHCVETDLVGAKKYSIRSKRRRKIHSTQSNPYRRQYARDHNSDSSSDIEGEIFRASLREPWDSDFEPTKDDLEDYREEKSQKFVIRRSKSKREGENVNDEQKKKIVNVIKLAAGKYSYSGFEFEQNKEGVHCSSCQHLERKKVYKSRNGVLVHIRHRHLNEPRSNLCSTCGKSFYKPHELRHHMMTHDEDTVALICHLCGNTYKTETSLSSHIIKVHEAVYGFPCTLCSEQFKSNTRLQQHIKKHLPPGDKKPTKIPSFFACEFCDSTFKWKENFTRHIQRYHSLGQPSNKVRRYPNSEDRHFQCLHCDHKYRREVDLTFHIKRIHTKVIIPPVLFKCRFCDHQYKTQVTMRRHEIAAHQNEPGFKWERGRRKKNLKQSKDDKDSGEEDGQEREDEDEEEQEEDDRDPAEEQIIVMDDQMHVEQEEICLPISGF